MKIQLQIHETTISVERENDDLTIDDMFEAFNTLLIGATFHPDTIKEWILRKSNVYEFYQLDKMEDHERE